MTNKRMVENNETRKLKMYFKDEDSNTVSITVDNPKYDIKEVEIKECMELIVQKDIFLANGLSLVSCEDAQIIQTSTDEYDLVIE
jgi:hypothetical protein